MRPLLRPVSLLLCLGLGGCNDSTGLGPVGVDGNTMSATIDGLPWAAVQVTVTRGSGSLSVAGSDSAPLAIGFTIQEAGTGTYTIAPTEVTSANVTNLGTVWTAASGTVTFTTIETNRVIGSFEFTAPLAVGSGAAERVVTSGVFDATF